MEQLSDHPVSSVEPASPFTPILDEHRESPRVVISLAGRLQIDDDSPLQVVVHDVSPDSMQVRCAPSDVDRLTSLNAQRDLLVSIWLHLPFRAGALNLKADCLITHSTRQDDGTIALGLQFESFSRIGARILRMFIDETLQLQRS